MFDNYKKTLTKQEKKQFAAIQNLKRHLFILKYLSENHFLRP